MSVFYFKISRDNLVESVVNHSMPDDWFRSIMWDGYLDKPLSNFIEEKKVVEVNGVCFCYEEFNINNDTYIFFSQEKYLKVLYQIALDCTSEALQVFDKNGYLAYANKSSEQLEKYDFEEYRDKHLLDLYDLSEDYSTTLSVLRTGEPVINRCDRFITKDNKELVTINSGYPVLKDGEIFGACVFESDMASIKNIEDRLFNLEHFIKKDVTECKQVRYTFKDIIYSSINMQETIKYAKKAALSQANILIQGETGTGKELIAQSIHDYSKRYSKPFVDINCSALPSNLVESIFFGTEKGAYTGSVEKKGLFEVASGGTLFLDEVNAMEFEIQAKLLRVIQEKRYQRVGGNTYHSCDVRIIASINENPMELIEIQRLRKDLYYRLAGMIINISPLRERIEDIKELGYYFLSRFSTEFGRDELSISKDVIDLLEKYEWPGNVRELEHVITSAAYHMTDSERVLRRDHLPSYIEEMGIFSAVNRNVEQNLNRALIVYEKQHIEKVLRKVDGNITQAAKILCISRQNLQYRLKKHNISGNRRK